MKKAGKYILFVCGILWSLSGAAEMVLFDNLNLVVPDNDSFGVADTQSVSGMETEITSIQVYLNIGSALGDYAYNGDLYVQLQHDSGFSVLLNRVGRNALDPFGYAEEGLDVVFTVDDSDIHAYGEDAFNLNANGQLTGNWGVDGRNVDPQNVLSTDPRTAMLSSFIGLDPNGSWTLLAMDETASGVSQINSWGMDIQTVPEPLSMSLLMVAGGALFAVRRLC